MTSFKADIRNAIRPRPLPWHRRLWVKLCIGFALWYLRLVGPPKVPPEAFERSARKYRADKTAP